MGAAHAAAAAGEGDGAGEGAAESFAGDGAEGFEGALEDSLGGDVDPGAGGHLAVHDEAFGFEFAEFGPGGPVTDKVGVGDEDAGCPGVGFPDGDGFAGLDEEGFVGVEVFECGDDGVEGVPVAGGFAGATVDDEVVGAFGYLGVKVVHEHAHGRFGLPGFGGEGGAAGGADFPGAGGHGFSLGFSSLGSGRAGSGSSGGGAGAITSMPAG